MNTETGKADYGRSSQASGSPGHRAALTKALAAIRSGRGGVMPNGNIVDRADAPSAIPIPPAARDTHRTLQYGEIIERGDEVLGNGKWRVTTLAGHLVRQEDAGRYRRIVRENDKMSGRGEVQNG